MWEDINLCKAEEITLLARTRGPRRSSNSRRVPRRGLQDSPAARLYPVLHHLGMHRTVPPTSPLPTPDPRSADTTMMRRPVYRCVMVTAWSTALLLVAPPSGWSMQAGQGVAGASVPQDVVAQARQWATSGKRAEAIASLIARLTSRPDDLDARVLLGIIYTVGRPVRRRSERTEARLTDRPGYYDAMSALTYTELWDGHQAGSNPGRGHPEGESKDTSVLLALAARTAP